MPDDTPAKRNTREWLVLAAIGLAAGFLSGLFGVGGGVIIVPALVAFAAFGMRLASGTSLAAIVPTALVGIVAYAMGGNVAWVPALLLIVGSVTGAQFGSWLLDRLRVRTVRWSFVAFLVVVIASLLFTVPSRDATIDLTIWSGIGLTAVGLATGVLSGLLGVGGGVVIVPALMLLFGASDLVAKGTSLLVMIPTALSGSIGNLRHHNVDLRAAAAVGLGACCTTGLGAWAAGVIPPQIANWLFAGFLLFTAYQMARKAMQDRG